MKSRRGLIISSPMRESRKSSRRLKKCWYMVLVDGLIIRELLIYPLDSKLSEASVR